MSINNEDFSSIVTPNEKRTIVEDVEHILGQFLYEANDKNVRSHIVQILYTYFGHRTPRDKFTFTDETTDEDVNNGILTIMVDTPWVNAGDNGRMLLGEFAHFASKLEQDRAFSYQFVKHSMGLSLVVGKRLKVLGKKWEYVDELLGKGMSAKIKGGVSDLTMRQLAKLEVALDLVIVREFPNKELGLKR